MNPFDDANPFDDEPKAGFKTPKDSDIEDFLSGKRDDVPNIGSGLPKERADSIMRQWSKTPGEQERVAKSAYAKQNLDQIGTFLSAEQGPSLGLTPRIAGALGKDPRQYRQAVDSATDEHPVANVIGAMAGGPSGAETFGGRVLVGGLQSAVTQAARADDGDQLKQGAVGGLAGAAGTAVADGVLRGTGALVAPALKRVAQSQAIRALNPLKRDVTMLANQGIEGKLADDLLSSGVMKPGSNSANIAKRVAPELEKRGAAVGASRTAIDDAARGDVVRPADLADSVERLADEYAAKPVPEMQSIAEDLRARAALIRAKPHMSLTDAEEKIKQPMDDSAMKLARTVGQPPDKLEALAQVRRLVKQGNEHAAMAVDPELGGRFIDAKQGFGRMASAGDILERNNPRALANRALSPSDYGFGIATGQGYRPPPSHAGEEPGEKAISGLWSAIAAALHRQVRERGNSTMAHVANVGSKVAGVAGAGTAPIARALSALSSQANIKPTAPVSPEEIRAVSEWLAEQEKKRAGSLATSIGGAK